MGTTIGYRSDSIYVGVIDLPHLNAQAAGGGYFAITNRLLDVNNQCVLWGIVAHEVAHDHFLLGKKADQCELHGQRHRLDPMWHTSGAVMPSVRRISLGSRQREEANSRRSRPVKRIDAIAAPNIEFLQLYSIGRMAVNVWQLSRRHGIQA
jgi:hypothetical protein